MSSSVIETNQERCEIHYNIFSNAQSRYDLKVSFTGEGEVNATQNWWDFFNSVDIADRIYDREDDYTALGLFCLNHS